MLRTCMLTFKYLVSVPPPPLSLSLSTGDDEMASTISLDEAKVLDFLICAAKDGGSPSSITDLAVSSSQASKSGYSKVGICMCMYTKRNEVFLCAYNTTTPFANGICTLTNMEFCSL